MEFDVLSVSVGPVDSAIVSSNASLSWLGWRSSDFDFRSDMIAERFVLKLPEDNELFGLYVREFVGFGEEEAVNAK